RLELGAVQVLRIGGERVDPPGRRRRVARPPPPPAQLGDPEVADAVRGQALLQRLPREVRAAARAGEAAHVRDAADRVGLADLDQLRERSRRVPDGEELCHCCLYGAVPARAPRATSWAWRA